MWEQNKLVHHLDASLPSTWHNPLPTYRRWKLMTWTRVLPSSCDAGVQLSINIYTRRWGGRGGGGLCAWGGVSNYVCVPASWYHGILVFWCTGVLVCWSWRLGKSLENLRVGIRQLCLPLSAQQVAAKCCTALHGGFLCSWLSVLLGNLPAILPSCHPAVPAFLAKGVMFMRWATGRIRVNKLTKI